MEYQKGDLVFSQTWQSWGYIIYRFECEPKIVLADINSNKRTGRIVSTTDILSISEFWKICYDTYNTKLK